jgi:chemotaxis-related protein WspD
MSAPQIERCWAEIGTWGDGTCPLLFEAAHCRNCEIFANKGRRLLDRVPPADYIDGWTAVLADARKDEGERQRVALVVSLGEAYYAVPVAICREAMDAVPIRRIPHRSDDFVLGLVGVRGELRVCLSLAALGLDDGDGRGYHRMVLLERREGGDWVVPVTEIHGIHRYGDDDIEPIPMTVSQSPNPYTIGLVRWQDRLLGVLDDELLIAALARRLE